MFDINDPKIWVDYADRSYIATRLLSLTSFMLDAPVNAHRSIELYLKAFLVSNGARPVRNGIAWGHNLDRLRKFCEKHNHGFANTDLKRRIAFFQHYFDFIRYPGEPVATFEGNKIFWLGFDSTVLPLDEIVAYVRPRIKLSSTQWESSWLMSVFKSNQTHLWYQKKAILDGNSLLKKIICSKTTKTRIRFNADFSLDQPNC